ncbi:MAG: rhomboid family intramembrane serine protease [Candidatus Acidiferrales bacterium]
MIPLKDSNVRRTFPFITLGLIAINVIVFIHQVSLAPRAEQAFVMTYGMVPAHVEAALQPDSNLSLSDAFIPLLTSMFLHGGWLHILGNMWFLWIFGDNVEDELGHFRYLIFYLICGLGSGIAQLMFSWGSGVPAIGASGAISGVLGAYMIFFPGTQVLTLVPLLIFFFTVRLPAVVFIGVWFAFQFLSGVGSVQSGQSGGVAWWAHVGGFLLGILLVKTIMQPVKRRGDYG